MTTVAPTATARPTGSAITLRLLGAVVVAAVVNTLVALGASALDGGGIGMGLDPLVFLPATVVGVAIGAAGWTLLRRRAPRTLPVVVPTVLVLTWIPDLLLLGAGATVANVVGLMLMHTVIAGVVVAALRGRT